MVGSAPAENSSSTFNSSAKNSDPSSGGSSEGGGNSRSCAIGTISAIGAGGGVPLSAMASEAAGVIAKRKLQPAATSPISSAPSSASPTASPAAAVQEGTSVDVVSYFDGELGNKVGDGAGVKGKGTDENVGQERGQERGRDREPVAC
mmetsp:Transcript_14429/g.31621  ORF Transcript_14429/g.31621 Transcript_14429/m.31621 type:complete len:148 (-) Transcript_14429:124-567(-)